MKAFSPLVLSAPLLLALLAASPYVAFADEAPQETTGTFTAQPGKKAPGDSIRKQNNDDRTLEIQPQPGLKPRDKSVEEIPADKEFTPDDNTAAKDKKFEPNGLQNPKEVSKAPKLPYLGISVAYTQKCYLGQEERGLEILTIDPNSPAAQAGLQSKGKVTPLGAAGVTAGALLGPLELAVVPLLQKAGQLGQDGDLIVAVDDHRVRSELDLEDELAKLKPGDTMYLTVIRPLPGGNHKTMKIEVKVGQPTTTTAQAETAAPSGTEQFAY